jgi:glucokinase
MAEILAADVGGTNSRFAHFTADSAGGLVLRNTVWLETSSADSFTALIQQLGESDLGLAPREADAAVFAVAGPVERGGRYSNPPLIPWDVDIHDPAQLGLTRAVLINDFVAQAYACRTGPGEMARHILEGRVSDEGAAGVIGAGTGLGKAVLMPDGHGGWLAVASEGGHAAFPFMGAREFEYQSFLQKTTGFPYPTGNVVLSGRGLRLLHLFLTDEDHGPAKVAEQEFGNPESETLRWFARFYGRGARDFALEALATGGLYVAGGIAARNPEVLTHPEFEEEFRSAPEHAELMAHIPVYLITDEQSGLWGAAFRGQLELREDQR